MKLTEKETTKNHSETLETRQVSYLFCLP